MQEQGPKDFRCVMCFSLFCFLLFCLESEFKLRLTPGALLLSPTAVFCYSATAGPKPRMKKSG